MVIRLPTLQGDPFILAIGFDHNAFVMDVGWVGNGAFLNRDDSARTAGMQWGADKSFGMRNELAGEYTIAYLDDGLCRFSDVLLNGQC